jgi:hypothetical protein
VGEVWLYPDNSRVLELSTKCRPRDALDVAASTRSFLLERGITLESDQAAKTKRALEYFAGEMS